MSWRAKFERRLTQSWQERGALTWVLLPVATVYKLLEAIRRLSFAIRIRKVHRVSAKVIVVGNVIAGGAGKTPTLLALAESLQKRGYVVGVISRGYGRNSKNISEVFRDSDPLQVGDEPLLIHRKLSLPVFVGSDRVATAELLLKRYPKVDTILSDDGLQHLSLFRDLEIVVFDNRGVGNGLVLPAGPLRSAWPPFFVTTSGQSVSAQLVLHTGSNPAFCGFRAQRRLSLCGVQANGAKTELRHLQGTCMKLIAVAAIATPDAFFEMLAASGIQTAGNYAYPDHWDFANWKRPCEEDCIILCTEKDALKLWQHEPTALAIPLIQELEEAFVNIICKRLAAPRHLRS